MGLALTFRVEGPGSARGGLLSIFHDLRIFRRELLKQEATPP